MKRFIALINTVALALVSYTTQAALPTISIDADPAVTGIQTSLTVSPGDLFPVDIVISGVDASSPDGPLQGFEFDLDFDPAVLNASSVTNRGFVTGSIFTQVIEDDLFEPDVNFSVSAIGTTSGMGSGVLARITFNVLALGDADLILNDIKLSKPDGNPIGTNTTLGFFDLINPDQVNGLAHISSVPLPASGFLFLIGASLTGFFGFKRPSRRSLGVTAP